MLTNQWNMALLQSRSSFFHILTNVGRILTNVGRMQESAHCMGLWLGLSQGAFLEDFVWTGDWAMGSCSNAQYVSGWAIDSSHNYNENCIAKTYSEFTSIISYTHVEYGFRTLSFFILSKSLLGLLQPNKDAIECEASKLTKWNHLKLQSFIKKKLNQLMGCPVEAKQITL